MNTTQTTALPAGWKENRMDGTIACRHRDMSVCRDCDEANPAAYNVSGAHYWIPDEADRVALAKQMIGWEDI
jgi:hypothetical protein